MLPRAIAPAPVMGPTRLREAAGASPAFPCLLTRLLLACIFVNSLCCRLLRGVTVA